MSNNIAKDTESTKLDSTRESIVEPSKPESKKDSKNKDEVRLDSNGDEIMYEAKHNPSWWDYFLMSVFFMFGIIIVYDGIESFLSNEIDRSLFITLLVFGIPSALLSFYYIFYARKNRFYITTQGIGFERRKWFRMQKGFFKFGEVGAMKIICTAPFLNAIDFITIFPLGNIKRKYNNIWRLKPYCFFCLIAWDFYISPKIYNSVLDEHYLHNFLIKKTKEALESKGIDTNSLCYDLEKQFDIY